MKPRSIAAIELDLRQNIEKALSEGVLLRTYSQLYSINFKDPRDSDWCGGTKDIYGTACLDGVMQFNGKAWMAGGLNIGSNEAGWIEQGFEGWNRKYSQAHSPREEQLYQLGQRLAKDYCEST